MKKGIKATYIIACLMSMWPLLYYVLMICSQALSYIDMAESGFDISWSFNIPGSVITFLGLLSFAGVFNILAVNRFRNKRIVQICITALLVLASFVVLMTENSDAFETDSIRDFANSAYQLMILLMLYSSSIFVCFLTGFVHRIEKLEKYNDDYQPKISLLPMIFGAVLIVLSGVSYLLENTLVKVVEENDFEFAGASEILAELWGQMNQFVLFIGLGLLVIGALVTVAVVIFRSLESEDDDVEYVQTVQAPEPAPVVPAQNVKTTNSFCENCGTKLEESFAFCLNCGTKVKK